MLDGIQPLGAVKDNSESCLAKVKNLGGYVNEISCLMNKNQKSMGGMSDTLTRVEKKVVEVSNKLMSWPRSNSPRTNVSTSSPKRFRWMTPSPHRSTATPSKPKTPSRHSSRASSSRPNPDPKSILKSNVDKCQTCGGKSHGRGSCPKVLDFCVR